jgi:hypothetical protein
VVASNLSAVRDGGSRIPGVDQPALGSSTSCFWCHRTYSFELPHTLQGVIPSKRFMRLHSGRPKLRSLRVLDFEARTGEDSPTKPGICSRIPPGELQCHPPKDSASEQFLPLHGRLLGLRESWKMRLTNPLRASGVSGIPDCMIELGRKKCLNLLHAFAAFRAARKKSSETYFAR